MGSALRRSLVMTVAAAAFRVGLDVAASLMPGVAAEAMPSGSVSLTTNIARGPTDIIWNHERGSTKSQLV